MSDKTTAEEVEVMGEILTPGRKFKIDSVHTRALFEFLYFVTPENGSDPYIEARDLRTGGARSFSLDRIAKVVPLPKSRRRKMQHD